jgi:dimethylamine---corrinoid protein Co-methyltransferase
MSEISTRYGDGTVTTLSEDELKQEFWDGTEDAADRGNIPVLSEAEIEHLFDIFKAKDRFVSVEPGREVVLSYDGAPIKMARTNISVDRLQSLQIYEKLMGADTLEMGHIDYSFKPIKPIVGYEEPLLEQALMITTAPVIYGAMPNLGLYSQPDGPFPNPAELMPQGKIEEAQKAYEAAAEEAINDIVFVGSSMYEAGADAIMLDTVGAAGDADVYAGLKATEILKEKYPDICIELGAAGEFVLGMHGGMEYNGVRLAGLYMHELVKLAEAAGVTIFGPVVNSSTSETIPRNVARAVTYTKACCDTAKIPIHANMGMGVGAVAVNDYPPIDTTSRASKAMVEICRLDGL